MKVTLQSDIIANGRDDILYPAGEEAAVYNIDESKLVVFSDGRRFEFDDEEMFYRLFLINSPVFDVQ